jgi:hypothetical protein
MPRHPPGDDNALPVTVPRNTSPLVPVAADRVRRLREHLVKVLREARELRYVAKPSPPRPSSFAAQVAATACRLCEGACCRLGGDDAFLDRDTIARVRRDKPDLDASAIISLFSERVPGFAYEGSCIFHGAEGCTLSRDLRADICNVYYCRGLTTYFRSRRRDAPQVIFAGKGDNMRSSQALRP